MVVVEKATLIALDPDTKREKIIDLGFVGKPKHIDRKVLDLVIGAGLIPVIAPVCLGEDGNTYNVNADIFAGAITEALNATRLLFLTDVEGVLDRSGKLQRELSVAEAKEMLLDGTISGGMIPKVESCMAALEDSNSGVEGVVIVNGHKPHAVMLELFTRHGAGTRISR